MHALTEELVARGHKVTLFASGDSQTSAELVSVYPRALREARIKDLYGLNYLQLLNIGLAYSRQAEFDIIHDHTGHLALPAANIATTPVVMTMHGSFTSSNRKLFTALDRPALVCISQAQANRAKRVPVAGVVHNGLRMEDYPFSEEHEGYLLFVGRISLEKGVHNAIEVAQILDMPLIIAAKLDQVDMPYFNEYVGPHLSGERIRWVGEVDEAERNRLMSRAHCFLHPITWQEPFGLTLIEAMACGCPVVAFNKGSIPEVILDGKTGYVVGDVDEMIEAIEEVEAIDREFCREYALQHFNAERMAQGYEKIYHQLLDTGDA